MKRPQSRGERVIRKNRLDQELAGHDMDIGKKVSLILKVYHRDFVLPISDRMDRLDAHWWEKLWYLCLRPILELYGWPELPRLSDEELVNKDEFPATPILEPAETPDEPVEEAPPERRIISLSDQ